MAKGIGVRLYGDYDPSGVKKAQAHISQFDKQVKGFTSSFASSFTGLGAAIGGAFALTSVVTFLKDSAQAAMDDQVAMASLAKTMENVGEGFKTTGVEDFISKMQLATGVADNDLRGAFQKLVTVTGDAAKSQTALKLAMDISAGTGKDLASVSAALAKGFGGQTTALQRLGVGIDAATLKSKDMGAITDALSSKFGGQAAVAASTYQGQMNRLTQAVGEAQEAIGYSLLRALDSVIGKMGGTGGLQGAIMAAGDQIAQFVDDIAATIVQVDRLGKSLVSIATGGAVKLDDSVNMINEGFEAFLTTVLTFLAGPAVALYKFLKDVGIVSDDAAGSTSDLALANEHGARASVQAGKGLNGLAADTENAGDAAWYASKSYLALWESIVMAGRAERDYANTSGTVSSAIAQGAAIGGVAGYWERLRVKYGETDKAVRSVGSAAKAAEPEVSKFTEGVQSVQEALASLATEMPNYVQDMSTPTFAMLNGQIDALKSKFAEAKSFVESTISSFVGQLDLGAALEQSKAAGSSLVEAFVSQGEKVVEFGRKVNALVKQGLERPAWSAIMALGYERGTEVADKLAEGNVAGNIANVNKVYESVKTMGDEVAELAKQKFYDVGMQTMVTTLEAMIEQLMPAGKKRKQLLAMLDDLAASMYRKTYIDVEVRGPYGAGSAPSFGGAEFAAAMSGYTGPTFSSPLDLSRIGEGVVIGLPGFSEGGIATRPTLGIFGEAGSEALIPLDRMGDFGGGNTYNINVTAGVGDPRAIGKTVVEAITLFERSSGPVFARA